MPNRCILEATLRQARPLVLATLQKQFNDFELSEEALQEACLKALQSWPIDGTPDNTTAWLITVSRRAAIDIMRREKRHLRSVQADDTQQQFQIEDRSFNIDNATYRDDILRLMFCCCHPDLPAQDQMALALKVICGLPVVSIARALLCQEKAMEKRITRAKQKALSTNQDGGELPQNGEQKHRMQAVCSLIYLLFNEGYTNTGGDQHISSPLCSEAIRLCRLLLDLFPTDLEVMGLLALCLFNHSRRNARLDKNGELVPLDKQNRTLWQGELIAQGLLYRDKALRKNQLGPYQLQAAIAAEHCIACTPEETRWSNILRLYDKLFVLQPTPIVVLNRAVAVAKAIGIEQGLDELKQIAARLQNYLYYHTTLAGLLLEKNDYNGAKSAFTVALELNPTAQEKRYILDQLELINIGSR